MQKRWAWVVLGCVFGCGGDYGGPILVPSDSGAPNDVGPGPVVVTDTGPPLVCAPGRSETCACVGGSSGVQTCNADGRGYGPCVCQTERDAGTPLDTGPARICEPGRSVGCTCSSGSSGSQTCASNGQGYGSCVCASLDAGPARICEPGRSVSCTCANGAGGSQTCATDGQRYSACVCAPIDAGPIDTGPGLCSTSNPTGQCPGGQSCIGGLCVSPCSPSAPGGVCPSGQRCVSGACCASPCDSRCCTGGTFCVGPIAGSNQCVAHCRVSADCGTGSWCAALGEDGFCVPVGATVGSPRRCNIDTDCINGQACTPTVGADNIPRNPTICTDPACAPYRQCRGTFGSCPNGYCNLCGASGRCYCAQVCTSDAMCGTAVCAQFVATRGSCPATQTACAPRM